METIINKLKELGIDTEGALKRLGGNETLYISVCSKFLQDQNYSLFMQVIDTMGYEKAEIHLHTLKGVAANLGFRRLEACCKTIHTNIITGDKIILSNSINQLTQEYQRLISLLHTII